MHRPGCTSYRAGHNVHWIQALHTANRPEVSAQSWRGQIVTVDGELLTVRKPDGSLTRFRNHDPVRLVVILQRTGVDVFINDQYAILRVGAFCFSVKADRGEPLGPCPTDQPQPNMTAEQMLARVHTHGGFSAPAGPVEVGRRDGPVRRSAMSPRCRGRRVASERTEP